MSNLTVGIDVGGTTIKAALVDGSGAIRAQHVVPTPHDAALVVNAALGCYQQVAGEQAGHLPFGMVVPGVVDESRRVGVLSANLGWRDADFGDLMDGALAARWPGLAWGFGHDVRAGLQAEMAWGAARGHRSAIFLPIGTGIAAAIAVDGRVLVGGGYAGELGHVCVDPVGLDCGCGGRGCLESIASAQAIARSYANITGTPVSGAKEVFAQAQAGDAAAQAVLSSAYLAIGRVLSALLIALGPSHIVIGGGLALAGEQVLTAIDAAITLPFTPRPTLALATLGDKAAALGASLLAPTT